MILTLSLHLLATPALASDPASDHGEHAGQHEAHTEEHAAGEHAAGEHAAGNHHGHDDDATVTHRFDDASKWAEVFDDPARDAWQKPGELVAAMALQPGMTVADIGAGTGYFNPHLAEAVGADGTVVAIDIEGSLVNHMTRRARSDGTPQVQPRLGEADDPGLKPAEADLVMLVDTYHHVSDRVAYFTALREGVKPGGRLVIVDFKGGELPVGPPPDHRIAQDKVVSELTAAGWHPGESLDVLPHQFVQVMLRDAPTAE